MPDNIKGVRHNKGRKRIDRIIDNTWMSTCQANLGSGSFFEIDKAKCDWSQIAPNEAIGKILSVLHVLVKHPEQYKEITGKDPERAAFDYRAELEKFRRFL